MTVKLKIVRIRIKTLNMLKNKCNSQIPIITHTWS